MTPVIFDCDPGVDDALALALLLGREDVDLLGVTTVAGNVPLSVTSANALRLRDYFRASDVPVVAGAAHPLVRPNVFAAHVHGDDGLGGAPVPPSTRPLHAGFGPDRIVEQLAARPGEITLLATGPLTNLALALRREPRIAEWAAALVIMGGAWTRGNITPAAEFNFYADPEAAAVVLAAPWRPRLITLDITLRARVTDAILSGWGVHGDLTSRLLVPAIGGYLDGESASGPAAAPPGHVSAGTGPAVHDVVAAAYVVAPELFASMPAAARVETHGEFTSGMSVLDFGTSRPDVDVVTDVDLPGLWTLLDDAFAALARRMQQP